MALANRSWFMMLMIVAALTLCSGRANPQNEVQPTNDLPNPYQTTAPWGKLPDGRIWGALNAVAIDNDGESVWVADRCGANPEIPPGTSPFQYDSCAGSTVPPILKFDSSGNLVKSFGAGMFIFPHKIYMDRDGNLWVADQRSANERELTKSPQEKGKGHIVVKFSGWQGPIDARQIRGSRKSAGSFDSTDQHCDRPEWRFVHLGGPQPEYGCSPGDSFTHLEVYQGRQVHKVVRQNGIGAGRIQGASRSCHGCAGTTFRRRPWEHAHPDPRSGWEISRRMEAIQSPQRNLYSERYDLCRGLRIQRRGAASGMEKRDPNWDSQRRQGSVSHP